MLVFRVDRHDRVKTVVNAERVIADQEMCLFQVPHGADGEARRTQYRIPMRDVAAITRRVTEQTGAGPVGNRGAPHSQDDRGTGAITRPGP